jgi:hypothetical protein
VNVEFVTVMFEAAQNGVPENLINLYVKTHQERKNCSRNGKARTRRKKIVHSKVCDAQGSAFKERGISS